MKKRYNKKLDMSLFPLGFGVMRLHQNADGSFPYEVHSLLASAYEKGINFFDTSYVYLRGSSETLIRDALVQKYPRDTFYIADKLPVWNCKNREDMEQIFNKQLERLGVDYIDFYLLHGLHHKRWMSAYEKGVLDFLDDKKREGRIRKVGFSMHDTVETLQLIESAYDWEFVLLQINYYDWTSQRANENYEYLAQRDIPCMVMEPVGGGRLSKLPPEAAALLNEVNPGLSESAWALKFVANLPNVVLTLSGMNNIDQLEENIKLFSDITPLSKNETDALDRVVEIINSKHLIPCTYCRYCVDDCKKGIDIPNIFQRFNDSSTFERNHKFSIYYYNFVPKDKRGNLCVSCGKCVEMCPQNIDIPKELKKIHDAAVSSALGIDIAKLRNKENIVLFGSGDDGKRTLKILEENGIDISRFCDNNPNSWGTTIDGIEVAKPQDLDSTMTILITSSKYHNEIKKQLHEIGLFDFD